MLLLLLGPPSSGPTAPYRIPRAIVATIVPPPAGQAQVDPARTTVSDY